MRNPTRLFSSWLRVLLPLLLCSGFLLSASALPFFDSFSDKTASGGSSFAVGSDLAGQTDGLGDIWNAINPPSAPNIRPTIVAGNLTSANLPQSVGNSVSFAPAAAASNGGKGVRLNFGTAINTVNSSAYYSFLLKVTDITNVTTNSDVNFFCGWSDGNGAQNASVARVACRIVTKKVDSNTYVLGISRNNIANDSVYDTNVLNVGDTVFVVGEYDRIGGVTNVNLWVNPPNSSFGSNAPPTPTVSVSNVTSFAGDINTTASAAGFVILCQSMTAPSGVLDEVRIGTDWTFVTGGDPAVLTNPADVTAPPGNNVSFSATARGAAPLSYQWYKDGITPLTDGGNISGSTTLTLNLNNISGGDAGKYSLFVTNGVGNFAQSGSATLVVLTDPLITSQPGNVATNFGATATFQVVATGTAPLTYQWHKDGFGDLSDGGNISGSHSDTLSVIGVAFPDGGNYYVTVSNALGVSVDSARASLAVLDPYITTNPAPVTVNSGGSASFHVDVAGTGPFTYEWMKNGNIIFGGANISGAFSDTLTISPVSSADQAGYAAIVIGSFGTVTSSVANLTVLSAVSIAVQPQPRAMLVGTRAAFSVRAAGSGTLSYQWQKDGVDIPGANSPAYVLANIQTNMQGNYSVTVSNSFSSAASSPAALTVSNLLTLAEENLVIVRVGDGAQALTVNGNSIYLDQYTPDGAYVNTITIPDDGPTALTAIGWDNINGVQMGSTTGTILTRSLDGRFMVLAGYNTNLNYGASLGSSSATNVPKGIALIDSYGQYSLPVASTYTGFDAGFWRAGITDGTNNFWGSANITGTYYFGFDAPPAVIQNTMVNMRSMTLINGDIYAVSAATPTGVLKISGMPTTNSTSTILFSGTTGSFDLSVSPDGNLIYVCDQRAISAGGGVQRYDFNGSSWALTYTLNTGFTTVGPRYIATDFSGPNPVLYVTSNEQSFDNDRLIRIVDTGSTSAGTALASSGPNQTFRSLHFGPVQNYVFPQPRLSFVRSGSNLVLSWTGAYTLQSSTTVNGSYVDVSSSSPYTNVIGAELQKFFRLRQ